MKKYEENEEKNFEQLQNNSQNCFSLSPTEKNREIEKNSQNLKTINKIWKKKKQIKSSTTKQNPDAFYFTLNVILTISRPDSLRPDSITSPA